MAMLKFGGRCIHVDNGIRCVKNSIYNLDELDLAHPNGDGKVHRALISNRCGGVYFYQALKDRDWDTDGFDVQVMCKLHHANLDRYKKGKFNNPDWLRKKYAVMSTQEIADLCGVSCTLIRNRMIKFKLERRKRGQGL
jgi:hypothetical protein